MPIHQIIDTHCHYNLDPLYANWQQHWQEAKRAGVIASLVVGTNEVTSQQAVEIAAHEPRLLAAVGLHPTEVSARSKKLTFEALQHLFDQCLRIGSLAAIGETGLDYFRLSGSETERRAAREKQVHALNLHLQLAREHQLPALLHVRDEGEQAYRDVVETIQPHAASMKIILHCFSGPDWYVKSAIKLGCYISFAGNISYPSAEHLRQLLRHVPMDKLLVETDAPYLPPQSHRGQICEPAYVSETVDFLQSELGVDPQQLVNNARSIFTTIPATL